MRQLLNGRHNKIIFFACVYAEASPLEVYLSIPMLFT